MVVSVVGKLDDDTVLLSYVAYKWHTPDPIPKQNNDIDIDNHIFYLPCYLSSPTVIACDPDYGLSATEATVATSIPLRIVGIVSFKGLIYHIENRYPGLWIEPTILHVS